MWRRMALIGRGFHHRRLIADVFDFVDALRFSDRVAEPGYAAVPESEELCGLLLLL